MHAAVTSPAAVRVTSGLGDEFDRCLNDAVGVDIERVALDHAQRALDAEYRLACGELIGGCQDATVL